MVYKRYVILMVLLIGGLLAAATSFALRDTPPPPPETLDILIDRLGHPDPVAARKAKEALRSRGKEAIPMLQQAARSSNLERAQRARALLEHFGPSYLD